MCCGGGADCKRSCKGFASMALWLAMAVYIVSANSLHHLNCFHWNYVSYYCMSMRHTILMLSSELIALRVQRVHSHLFTVRNSQITPYTHKLKRIPLPANVIHAPNEGILPVLLLAIFIRTKGSHLLRIPAYGATALPSRVFSQKERHIASCQ